MNRGRRRKLIIIAALAVLLLLMGLWYWNYRRTHQLGFDFEIRGAGVPVPPEYLYSFAGEETDRLERPLGVLVDGNRVLVTDGRKRRISVFNRQGKVIGHWGADKVIIPLYVAKHPKTGDYWVTDRRLRTIVIFGTDGRYLREFDPKLPKEQLAKFDTKGFQWAPVALTFAPDGTLYVTEILNGHRLLIFDPSGRFVRSVGTAGVVQKAEDAPEVFQFPNSVKVHGDEVWVSDSNNRRLQIFNRKGDYVRLVKAEGLPRGFDFLPRVPGQTDESPDILAIIDTLSHDGTIWDVKGGKLLTFGERGVLEGQFSYPNDLSVAKDNGYIFIADTANSRVQVWGWPEEGEIIPRPRTPWQWALCGSPLLLLPLLVIMRRRRFFATPDFVEGMLEAEFAYTMPARTRRWIVTPTDYDLLKDLSEGDLKMSELLEPYEHSESDARSLMERLELEYPVAVVMSIAQRSKVFCTENAELRRIAKVLDVDVVDREEFLERFARKRLDEQAPPPPAVEVAQAPAPVAPEEGAPAAEQGTETPPDGPSETPDDPGGDVED